MPIQRLRRVAILMLTLAVGGCDAYLARRDAITADAGYAVHDNIVAQAVDMHPRGAENPNLTFSAERLVQAPASPTPDLSASVAKSRIEGALQNLPTQNQFGSGGL